MASEGAWNLGWQTGQNRATERRERRQALSDEQRQLHVTGLYGKGNAIAKTIPSLAEGSAERQKAMGQLTDIEAELHTIYHPLNNPGALQKDWRWLSELFARKRAAPAPEVFAKTVAPGTPETTINMNGQTITLPATPAYSTARPQPQAMTPPQRQRMANRDAARQRAEQDVAAVGLSPEQEAAAGVRSKMAQLEGTMQALDRFMGPQWNSGEKERTRLSLMRQALNADPKEKYYPQIISTKDAAGQEHYYRVPQAADADPEEIEFGPGQKMVPKTAPKAQGLKYDKLTNQVVDPATGKRYNAGDPNNPPEVNAMFTGADKMLADTRAFQTRLAGLRATSYNASKPLASYDSWNGNAPTEVPFSEYSRYPGRYLPTGAADKAIAKENLMQDLAGTSQLTRDAINNLREDFPADMKAKIALSMRADNPHAALDQLIASGALGSLSPDQQDFLIATKQLAENAMSMRSILGAGQGSQDVRDAVRDTLPSLLSPDRSYALRQLDAYDKTIARLHRGVPRVPLNEQPFPAGGGAAPRTGAAGAGAKGSRSIAAAMKYWTDKGQPKTEPWVIDDIQKHGYTPTRP
jgi:hypothetical protein